MANLTALFKRAERQLSGTRLRPELTQEVLELPGVRGGQGLAWRTFANPKVLQLYPPTAKLHAFHDGPFFVVVTNSGSECRYRDPAGRLHQKQWNYVGCSDCSVLADDLVWGWIQDAYQYLKRDKETKHN